ncbi:MAG: HAMP domain-containing histidine kinase [Deltaproteobacteria bacterium]|nr:HAMP domain-containing histidine kinase [Deltaproteobacteria bacterium]
MKVTAKLLLAFLSITFVVLALNTYLGVEREKALFETDMRKDAAGQAVALARGVEMLVERGELDAARDLVRDADESVPHLRLRWVRLEARAPADERPMLPPRELRELPANGLLQQRIQDGSKGAALLTYQVVGGRRGQTAIEVEEPLAEETAFIRESILRSIAGAGVLFVAAALVTTLAGLVLVGRAIRKLRAKARRAGTGDFTEPLLLRQHDELRDLADELNGMCDRLAESRRAIDEAHAARIAALEQVRRADRLSTVGQLAAGIAHEIGTPLGVVAGRAKMIATGQEEGTEARESARIVEEQAKRIATIIRQLLDFSRKRAPEKADLDLVAMTKGVIDLLDQMARKSGVTLAIDETPADGLRAIGDGGQLQQAVTNLVVNALQACSRNGKVDVSLGREHRRPPTDQEGPEAEWIRLSVSDTGCGMDAETISRVFEPFFTTKDVGEGTGLGLAVTHGIVAEHGGWIDVESKVGKGSRFSIHLPAPTQGTT